MINLVKIAHIGSTQGKAGALKFYPEEHLEESLDGIEFIFLKINGSKVPYKVRQINQSNNPWLLYIDEISGPEQAHPFTNHDVFAESEKVNEVEKVVDEPMKGFKVFSTDGTPFGQVLTTEEHPQQILLVVEWNDDKHRIPFHPDIIEEMVKETKSLTYTYSTEDMAILFS